MFQVSIGSRPMGSLVPSCILTIAIGLLGGCVSVDARPDLQRGASIVFERGGVATDWTRPWDASLVSWDGSEPLPLESALAMALRNNRELRAEVEQISLARADLAQAGLLPNPMLTMAFRVPVDPVEGGTFVGAGVMQSFVALWLRGGRVRAADARLNQAVLGVSDRALKLAAEVKATYARIGFAEQEARLVDEAIASSRQTIEILEARVTRGEGTALDVNRARQMLSESEIMRMIAARELARDRRMLLELMGFPSAADAWSVSQPAGGSFVAAEEEEAVRLALAQRLDVAASGAIIEAHAADLSIEELSRVRELSVGLDAEREHGGERSAGPVLSAAVPIFDMNDAQIARAGAAARAAVASYEAAAQRAIREARVAWSDHAHGCRLVEQQRSAVLGAAERNAALAEAELRAGQADVTAFLEAQREVIRAKQTLLALERETELAAIELERAVGGRLSRSD